MRGLRLLSAGARKVSKTQIFLMAAVVLACAGYLLYNQLTTPTTKEVHDPYSCPECGKKLPQKDADCPWCKAKQVQQMMKEARQGPRPRANLQPGRQAPHRDRRTLSPALDRFLASSPGLIRVQRRSETRVPDNPLLELPAETALSRRQSPGERAFAPAAAGHARFRNSTTRQGRVKGEGWRVEGRVFFPPPSYKERVFLGSWRKVLAQQVFGRADQEYWVLSTGYSVLLAPQDFTQPATPIHPEKPSLCKPSTLHPFYTTGTADRRASSCREEGLFRCLLWNPSPASWPS